MASQSDYGWQTTKRTVLERNCFMFNNPLISDIMFTCGESKLKSFYAHKYVLATSSPVFYAMFFGDLADNKTLMHLSDADDESFEQVLRFIYTDQCELTPEIAINVMYQAKKYIIPSLSDKCVELLSNSITPNNTFTILELSIQYSEPALEQKCWSIIDSEPKSVIASEDIVHVNQRTLKMLLKRDTLDIEEVELYKAIYKWIQFQCVKNGLDQTLQNRRAILGDALYEIRFLAMSQTEFTHEVTTSGLLTVEESLSILQRFNGLSLPDLPWKLSKRGVTLLRYTRLSPVDITPPDCSWSYNGCPDRLCLQIDGSVVTGTFSSEFVRHGRYSFYGFDVMLREPLKITKGRTIEMVARITGPESYYYKRSKLPEGINGLTITFSNSSEPANGTDSTRGQFYALILQECKE